MLKTMRDYDIDPASLIHALQNHDELTLELVHFWTLHANDTYTFGGRHLDGRDAARAPARDDVRTAGRRQCALQSALRYQRRRLHHRQRNRGGAEYPRSRMP